jgi:polyhydroxyalkanoate synthesis repressor PhaR
VPISSPRRIKRYDNRKLYDAAERRYVTLGDLAVQVAQGDDLSVTDQRTGEDLTSLTLAQVLLEGLRQRTARLPRPLLVHLIRLSVAPQTALPSAQEAAHRAGAQAERIASGLLARGRLTLDEAMSLRQEIVGAFSHVVSDVQAGASAGLHRLFGTEPPRGRRRTQVPARRGRKASGPRRGKPPQRKGRR